MKDLLYFLKFLRKRLYILILVPLITMIAAWVLAKMLPDVYRSQGRVATGIVDKTDQIIASEKDEQDQEIGRRFDNIIQLMRLKNVLDQVSYRLLIHDLKAHPDSAYTPSPKVLESLDDDTKRKTIALINDKYNKGIELSHWIPQEAEVYELLKKLGYSHSLLLDKLSIYRLANSDYITIEFEAGNPEMSAFVINTLYDEFLKIYSHRLKESSNRSLDFLEKIMLQKLAAMNERMEELKQFKIRNKVLNLNEQARSLYGHIIDFETRREVAKKDVIAYTAALKNIDTHFDPTERKYLESTLTEINREIALTKDLVKSANDEYIRTNFDPAAKSKLDSLQKLLTNQINRAADAYIYNPMAAKGDLITHKLNLEISLELAKNSIESIEKEVDRLQRKYEGMVPNEASIQMYETSIDIAGKEYIEALQRYNNARLESYAPISLKLAEKAMPGVKQPSKKLLLVIASGMAALVVCLFAFLVIFFLDNGVRTPHQLADLTGITVLGRLNKIPNAQSFLDPGSDLSSGKNYTRFKDLIRSIRFEVDEDTRFPKIISVTSLRPQAGKTTALYGLAWSYTRIHKRVLIIDGNFMNPEISKTIGSSATIENYFRKTPRQMIPELYPGISVLSNEGGDTSLLEITDELNLQSLLAELRQRYDVILIETPALTGLNKAKEWIHISDRVIAVYESGRHLGDQYKASLAYLRSQGAILSGWILANTPYDIDPVGKTLTKTW